MGYFAETLGITNEEYQEKLNELRWDLDNTIEANAEQSPIQDIDTEIWNDPNSLLMFCMGTFEEWEIKEIERQISTWTPVDLLLNLRGMARKHHYLSTFKQRTPRTEDINKIATWKQVAQIAVDQKHLGNYRNALFRMTEIHLNNANFHLALHRLIQVMYLDFLTVTKNHCEINASGIISRMLRIMKEVAPSAEYFDEIFLEAVTEVAATLSKYKFPYIPHSINDFREELKTITGI